MSWNVAHRVAFDTTALLLDKHDGETVHGTEQRDGADDRVELRFEEMAGPNRENKSDVGGKLAC